MTQQDIYQQWKPTVEGRVIGDGQCVSLVVNNPASYTEHLFPGVVWTTIFPPVGGARQLMDDANRQYFDVIPNNHNDPSQLPVQGDIMVFDATPQAAYDNKFPNPYGHTGVCESADGSGYNLLQQNSPAEGAPANVTRYPWHYRPCMGWLRPKLPVPAQPVVPAAPPVPPPTPTPTPAPAPAPVIPPTLQPPVIVNDPLPPVPMTPLPGLVNNVPRPSPTPTVQLAPEPQHANQGVTMQRFTAIALFLRKHAPVILLAVPVILQALIDKGFLDFPATTMLLVNSVLTLVGVGVIHKRLS